MPPHQTPARYTAKVTAKEYINASKKVVRVDFALIEPATIAFRAGQFINLKVDVAKYRSYSIANNCQTTQTTVSIIVDIASPGVGSNYLTALKLGDTVEFIGPSGRFCLPATLAPKLVFISTGTGLAPFLAMFADLVKRQTAHNTPRDLSVMLLQGWRHEDDVFCLDMLTQFKADLKGFDYKICISQPQATTTAAPVAVIKNVEATDSEVHYNTGRVTKYFQRYINTYDTQYFLCGHPDMVTEVSAGLRKHGVGDNCVFFERFTKAKVPLPKPQHTLQYVDYVRK